MAVASASTDRNTVITREKGIRGNAGADGTDGTGLNLVRESKLSSPIVKVLAANYPAVIGFDVMNWERNSIARGINKYGQLASADVGIPRETSQGWMIEGDSTNLLLNSDTLSTQSISVSSQPHVLSFYGTGTVTLSGVYTGSLVGTGTNDRVTLAFTPATGSLTVTVSGTVEYAQIEQSLFATSYITSAGTAGERLADDVYLGGFNNVPLMSEDFSIWMRLYFDGFTGNDDFIISLPNGFNTDDLTVCGFCNSGSMTFRISDGTTSADCTSTISALTQYDVCFIKAANEITLHVNGVLQDTQAHSINVPTGQNGLLKIGGNEAGTTKNMHGKLYDVRIYDFLLNESEVTFLSEV